MSELKILWRMLTKDRLFKYTLLFPPYAVYYWATNAKYYDDKK